METAVMRVTSPRYDGHRDTAAFSSSVFARLCGRNSDANL